jgi:hypothetical protein
MILRRHWSLSTNITLLDEESGVRLMESGLDYLVLPVDGVSGNAYEINRYPATLQDIEDRVEKFLLLKVARRSPIHVTLQMIRMRTTLHQVHEFKRRWRKPGVDSIRVRDELSGLPGNSLPSGAHRRRVSRPCFFLWRGPLCVQAAATLTPCPYYHGSEPFGDLWRDDYSRSELIRAFFYAPRPAGKRSSPMNLIGYDYRPDEALIRQYFRIRRRRFIPSNLLKWLSPNTVHLENVQ